MNNRCLMNQLAFLLQTANQILVAILAETSGILRQLVCKITRRIQRVCNHGQTVLLAHAEVIFAIRRSHVNKTRTIAGTDKGVIEHTEGAVLRML